MGEEVVMDVLLVSDTTAGNTVTKQRMQQIIHLSTTTKDIKISGL